MDAAGGNGLASGMAGAPMPSHEQLLAAQPHGLQAGPPPAPLLQSLNSLHSAPQPDTPSLTTPRAGNGVSGSGGGALDTAGSNLSRGTNGRRASTGGVAGLPCVGVLASPSRRRQAAAEEAAQQHAEVHRFPAASVIIHGETLDGVE